ncbi:MAG TPA: oligoribonuclease [Egibacteraceae bacterium]|jgi:oligoribonuclease|nr:oligoribonuclease [Egibacteraceae bacterium]
MDNPLVWIDLEMTGLDAERDLIVEVAAIVTDGTLATVVEGPQLVLHAPDDALDAMADVVRDMHAKSGLTEAVRASDLTVADAEARVLDFVCSHVPKPRSAPLAGNTISADRMFLRRYMPTLEAHVHYRNVDVSTVKELVRRWYPDVYAARPAKEGDHRALADIRESIEELRYYRRTVFR